VLRWIFGIVWAFADWIQRASTIDVTASVILLTFAHFFTAFLASVKNPQCGPHLTLGHGFACLP
jgi:hypothetical protein